MAVPAIPTTLERRCGARRRRRPRPRASSRRSPSPAPSARTSAWSLLEERLAHALVRVPLAGLPRLALGRQRRPGAARPRSPRSARPTCCPGPTRVLAPEWLPYADRLAPGDLGAGDVLPFRDGRPQPRGRLRGDGRRGRRPDGLLRARTRPSARAVRRGSRGRGQPVVRRRQRSDVRDRSQGDRALLDVRLLPADGRRAAGHLRRLRQRVEPVRRPRRLARPRLRGPLRDRRRPARAHAHR